MIAAAPALDHGAANAYAASTGRLPVVLQVDSGMNRQGVTLDEAKALAAAPDRLRHLDVKILMSHLGSATDPADDEPNTGDPTADADETDPAQAHQQD